MAITDTGGFLALIGAFFAVFLIIAIGFYIYFALALMAVAKRTKTENPLLAWIPVANLYLMSKIAGQHWWPLLLLIGFLIPFLNIIAMIVFMVYMFIWQWKICEARDKPGWWVLLQLIPFVGSIWGLVMWGILAWGK